MKPSPLPLVTALLFLVTAPGCGVFERCSRDEHKTYDTSKAITPVPEAQLASVIPEVPGFVHETPKTETRTDGANKLTRAYADYTKQADGKVTKLKLEIIDGTHFQAVNSRLAILAHAVSDVHMKQIKVKDQSGVQHFKTATESFEVLLVVGGRILVTLEGDKDVGQADIQAALEAIDFAKLESLEKASAVATPQ